MWWVGDLHLQLLPKETLCQLKFRSFFLPWILSGCFAILCPKSSHSISFLNLHAQALEFWNELWVVTKVSRSTRAWLDSSQGGTPQGAGGADTSTTSEAYAIMIQILILPLVDEVREPCFKIIVLPFYFVRSCLTLSSISVILLNFYTIHPMFTLTMDCCLQWSWVKQRFTFSLSDLANLVSNRGSLVYFHGLGVYLSV